MMSDFELKNSQRVTFCIEHYEQCQTFITKSSKMSSFDVKKLQSVRVWIKNFTTCHMLNLKLFKTCHFVFFKFHNVSLFESKILQRVTFWFKTFKRCQILKCRTSTLLMLKSNLASPHKVSQRFLACHREHFQPTKFRQLDSGIRRWYNSPFTPFHKDFDFWL